ncbi:hypothetical protein F971_01999 [Acinetobacter vivianii]|uniref:Uncharacterized protein n=1 Tax=Acinetobacter vivianii TaxID=1776742 RepID=N8W9Y4_9GAMM|nr:hypothetical protein [Acinetobacter vivianii]ENU92112.1 hypothetical protein F971_01999 [Acinetobacter vivianii]
MSLHADIYAPDGSLQLSTETKPIGRHKEYIFWGTESEGAPRGSYIIDPENKFWLNPQHFRSYSYPPIPSKEGYMYFMQLYDGVVVSFSPDYGTCIGPHQHGGRVLLADVREYNPTPQPNEHLQVFNQNGSMVWGSESLANSIQLIDWHTIWFGDHSYRSVPPLFFDVPHDVDMNRVFFSVQIRNALFSPQATDSVGVTQFPLLYIRRRGHRIYILPDFYTYFNTYTRYLSENWDAKLSTAVDNTELQALVMYVPNL